MKPDAKGCDYEEVIRRLTDENALQREQIREAQRLINIRIPELQGLTLNGSVVTIIDQRNQAVDGIYELCTEIKKAKLLIADGKTKEAYHLLEASLKKQK